MLNEQFIVGEVITTLVSIAWLIDGVTVCSVVKSHVQTKYWLPVVCVPAGCAVSRPATRAICQISWHL